VARLSEIRPAWIEVDLDAISSNASLISSMVGDRTAVMAVVKANGYGHGAVEVAGASLEGGASWLGVAVLSEGVELRRAGIRAPVLILGYTPDEQAQEVVENGLSQAVWTPSGVEALVRAEDRVGKPALIHLKIDTGMARVGARAGEELEALIRTLNELGRRRVAGTFTHFAAADTDPGYTEHQFATFMSVVRRIGDAGIDPGVLHCCNSAGLLRYPEYRLDMVRPGIALYGYPPCPAKGFRIGLSLYARLSHVKAIEAGTTVGYGCAYTAPRDIVVGTVPAGYADGYSRHLSNRGEVGVWGRRIPVVGRVCMDQFMVDATAVPSLKAGDTVSLIAGNGGPTAEEIADSVGTIVNDVLTGLSARLPRVYRKAGRLYTVDREGDRIPMEE
jgi:alanine racemase